MCNFKCLVKRSKIFRAFERKSNVKVALQVIISTLIYQGKLLWFVDAWQYGWTAWFVLYYLTGPVSVLAGGLLFMCGSSNFGQLGLGDTFSRRSFEMVPHSVLNRPLLVL